MDTTTYDQAIFAMRDVILRDYPFAIIRERLLELSQGEQNIAFIDSICSELGAACLQPLSGVVNRTTMIIAELAVNGGEQISMRMCQKDFQDYLMYTLRRLTTKLGNLLTIHPEVWTQIQTRVLNLYSFWYKKFENQDGKYFHVLQRYRFLTHKNIPFPAMNPLLQNLSRKNSQPKQVKTQLNPELLNDIKQLVEWCNSKVADGNTIQIMNTACVRNIKSRSQQLHKIWTTQTLPPDEKERVKQYYSSLRKLSKLIDAENQKNKAEEEKIYLVNKKNKIQTGLSKDGKIVSPQKSNNLLDQPSPIQKPIQNQTQLLATTSISPTKTLSNQIQLIDINDKNQEQPIIVVEKKPADVTKQLMEVFSSQQDIRSDQHIVTPTKTQKQEEDDQFSLFSAPSPSEQQIPAVRLINQQIESPTKLLKKEDDLIDLI